MILKIGGKILILISVMALLSACEGSERGALAVILSTETYTPSPSPTATLTQPPTATATFEPTPTATSTHTPTPSATFTATPKPTATARPTQIPTPTSTWDRYQPRTLRDIIKLTDGFLEGVQERPALYLENSPEYQYPSRIHVIYTGEFREISDEHQLLLDFWADPFGSRKEFADLFEHEALFIEGDTEYWIPVQEPLIPYMENELEVNKKAIIYVIWIGASMKSTVDKAERVFLLNEFRAIAP